MRSPEGKQEGYFNKRSADEKKKDRNKDKDFLFAVTHLQYSARNVSEHSCQTFFQKGGGLTNIGPTQRTPTSDQESPNRQEKPKNGSKEKAKRTMKRIALWNPSEGKKTSNHPKSSKQDGRRKAPPGKGRPRSSLAVPSCRCGV